MSMLRVLVVAGFLTSVAAADELRTLDSKTITGTVTATRNPTLFGAGMNPIRPTVRTGLGLSAHDPPRRTLLEFARWASDDSRAWGSAHISQTLPSMS